MKGFRAVCLFAAAALAATSAYASTGRHFEWSTKSADAKKMLSELQQRIENFQVGPANLELAKKMVAADPNWAMGEYYLSAVQTDPAEAEKIYLKSKELAKNASDGERAFIEAIYFARVNQGQDFKKAIEPMEAVSKTYSGERLVWMILGQLYNGDGKGDKAILAFQKAKEIGPRSARAESFL